MQAQTEPPSRSVLSSLQSVLGSLQSTFPPSSSAHLHPYSSRSSDIALQQKDLLGEVRTLRSSLESFRSSWTAEKDVVDSQFFQSDGTGQASRDLDSELDRRRTGVARSMMDWCKHDSLLLTTTSSLGHLSQLATPHRGTRTPFVHPQTLLSPTERLQAIAISIPLDVYLNNEDPDLGNATDQPGNVRIDTLSFGGERMAVDMDIRHPKWEAEAEVEVEVEAGAFQSGGPLASSSRRYQEADGWQVTKCEVSYVPLGGNGVTPEPIVLPRMSEVLSSYLARYIGIVNTYQLEQLSLNNNNAEDEEGEDDDSVLSIPFAEETESLALQAERVIIAFGENVAQIALLDKRMKKVEFAATATEPATPRPLTEEELDGERNWFVEAEEVGRMVDETSVTPPGNVHRPKLRSVFPEFLLFRSESMPNPTCSLKPLPKSHGPVALAPFGKKNQADDVQGMEVDQPRQDASRLDSSGWMLEIDEEVVVGQDLFYDPTVATGEFPQSASANRGGTYLAELLVPELKSVNHVEFAHRPTRPDRRTQRYVHMRGGIPGFKVSRFALPRASSAVAEVAPIRQAFQRALWLNRLYTSCFKPSMRSSQSTSANTDGDEEDLDADLELLISGETLPTTESSVTVQRTIGSLQLSFALPAQPTSQSLQMVVVTLTPLVDGASGVDFDIRFETRPSSLEGPDIDCQAAKNELIKASYDVPRWLEWLDVVVQSR